MQVLGSLLRPGFFWGAMSSFAKALPSASPHPMCNAPGRRGGVGVADDRCDEASARCWFDFADAAGLGTKAPTEQTLTTKAIRTRAKFVIFPSLSLCSVPSTSAVSQSRARWYRVSSEEGESPRNAKNVSTGYVVIFYLPGVKKKSVDAARSPVFTCVAQSKLLVHRVQV